MNCQCTFPQNAGCLTCSADETVVFLCLVFLEGPGGMASGEGVGEGEGEGVGVGDGSCLLLLIHRALPPVAIRTLFLSRAIVLLGMCRM